MTISVITVATCCRSWRQKNIVHALSLESSLWLQVLLPWLPGHDGKENIVHALPLLSTLWLQVLLPWLRILGPGSGKALFLRWRLRSARGTAKQEVFHCLYWRWHRHLWRLRQNGNLHHWTRYISSSRLLLFLILLFRLPLRLPLFFFTSDCLCVCVCVVCVCVCVCVCLFFCFLCGGGGLNVYIFCAPEVRHRRHRNWGPLCREPRATKDSLYKTLSGLEYSFTCFGCFQEFCLFDLYFLGSFNFIFSQLVLKHLVECAMTVNQTVILGLNTLFRTMWPSPLPRRSLVRINQFFLTHVYFSSSKKLVVLLVSRTNSWSISFLVTSGLRLPFGPTYFWSTLFRLVSDLPLCSYLPLVYSFSAFSWSTLVFLLTFSLPFSGLFLIYPNVPTYL